MKLQSNQYNYLAHGHLIYKHLVLHRDVETKAQRIVDTWGQGGNNTLYLITYVVISAHLVIG